MDSFPEDRDDGAVEERVRSLDDRAEPVAEGANLAHEHQVLVVVDDALRKFESIFRCGVHTLCALLLPTKKSSWSVLKSPGTRMGAGRPSASAWHVVLSLAATEMK